MARVFGPGHLVTVMAKEDRETLEEIASDLGAVAPEKMTDKELIDWITR